MSQTAVITVAHGRHHHLALQQRALSITLPPADIRCVVALADEAVGRLATEAMVVPCPTTERGLPLAKARNLGAARAVDAGADLLVFLDVDCLPGTSLIGRYRNAHQAVPGALLGGPVTYLPPSSNGYRLDRLPQLTDPHPARPAPKPAELVVEANYDLFWSLSFAVSAETWQRIGGFCEDYIGYGGEDTDFAAKAQRLNVPFIWVGGADAYHQFHPVSDPPVEHLAEIVANAGIFRRRWGRWPMPGWLDEFERRGLLLRRGEEIRVA